MLKRGILLLAMLALVGMVLGGGVPGPREASADCIDGCIYDYQQCVGWCGEDWSCRNQCDEQRHYCFQHCSP